MTSAGLLPWINRLLIAAGCGLLLVSRFADDHELPVLGSGLLIMCVALILGQWIAGSHTGRTLRRNPLSESVACVKQRNAGHPVANYRLRMALAARVRDRFRCPHSDQATANGRFGRRQGEGPPGGKSKMVR